MLQAPCPTASPQLLRLHATQQVAWDRQQVSDRLYPSEALPEVLKGMVAPDSTVHVASPSFTIQNHPDIQSEISKDGIPKLGSKPIDAIFGGINIH